MDKLDLAIYRALFEDQEARFWGSRSIIDPRISVAEVARRVHLSRTAVQSRLRGWRQTGFLLGYEVWPSPRLFGVRLCTVDIPVGSLGEVDRLFEELALVEGVISARDLMDEDGRTVRAFLIDDSSSSLTRRRRLIRRVAGLAEDPETHPYWIPEAPTTLSTLDWRVLMYYRAFPAATLSQASASLRVTAKTLSVRRDRLLNEHAMWWLMNTRSSRFPVAFFYIQVSDSKASVSVKRALETAPTGWLPCADDGFGLAPRPVHSIVSGLSMVESPASIDDVVREVAQYEGVVSVQWRIPRGFRSYREWYDRQLLAAVEHPALGRRKRPTESVRESNRLAALEPADRSVPLVELFSGDPVRSPSIEPLPESLRGPPATGWRRRRPRRDTSPKPSM